MSQNSSPEFPASVKGKDLLAAHHNGNGSKIVSIPQPVNEIKHEAGHDINRLAQMVFDLRETVHEQQETIRQTSAGKQGDIDYITHLKNVISKHETDAIRLNEEHNRAIAQYIEQVKAQTVLIENRDEELFHHSQKIEGLQGRLNDQCEFTATAARQLADARGEQARAEREHRMYVEKMTETLTQAMLSLERMQKLQKKLHYYEGENQALYNEHARLADKINARWIFRKVAPFVSKFRK